MLIYKCEHAWVQIQFFDSSLRSIKLNKGFVGYSQSSFLYAKKYNLLITEDNRIIRMIDIDNIPNYALK